mgnify:FL=1
MFENSYENEDATFLSETCHLEGNITGTSNIDIAGIIDGDIYSKKISILDTGIINGNIQGVSIEVDGKVEGNIEATSVYLGKNAIIRGDIVFFETLKTEEGADVDGYIKKNKKIAKQGSELETEKKYNKPVLVKDLEKKEAI